MIIRRISIIAVLTASFLVPALVYAQANDTWLGGAGGWSDASKWSAGVPSASSNVFIDGGNGVASAVTVDITNATCGTLTVDSDDTLNIPSGTTLTVNGTAITNNGKINITDNPSSAALIIAAGKSVTLSGSGVVTLTDTDTVIPRSFDAFIEGGIGSTLINSSTIQGSGDIEEPISNEANGLIDANQPNSTLFVSGGKAVNLGLLESTGGELVVGNVTIFNSGGTIAANGGIVANAGVIDGGTLTTNGGHIYNDGRGVMQATNGDVLTLSGVTNSGGLIQTLGSGSKVVVPGAITNFSTFKVGCGTLFQITGSFSNFSGTTLNGGHYFVCGTLQFNGANIVTNAGDIHLTAPSSAILDLSNNDALRNLASTASGGGLELGKNKNLATRASYSSSGTLQVAAGATFTVEGTLAVSHSSTHVDGTVTASSGMTIQRARVWGTGNIASAVSSSGKVFAAASILTACKSSRLSMSAYMQNSDGTLDVTIAGANAGTQYSQLAVANGASLNGVLDINDLCAFAPAIGDTFTILTANAVTGRFATVNGLSINSSEHYEITYNANNVMLTVVSGP